LHAAAPKDAEIGTGIAPSSASGREEVIRVGDAVAGVSELYRPYWAIFILIRINVKIFGEIRYGSKWQRRLGSPGN
jgi:hypothetical protein